MCLVRRQRKDCVSNGPSHSSSVETDPQLYAQRRRLRCPSHRCRRPQISSTWAHQIGQNIPSRWPQSIEQNCCEKATPVLVPLSSTIGYTAQSLALHDSTNCSGWFLRSFRDSHVIMHTRDVQVCSEKDPSDWNVSILEQTGRILI